MGSAIIRFQALIPENDLGLYYEIKYIDIKVNLSTMLIQEESFEAQIAPGESFDEVFIPGKTDITDSSTFSVNYSLLIQDFSTTKYYTEYDIYHRVLVSRDSNNIPYAFPENTKLTLIDMVTNKYYYYVVTQQDELNGKYIYNFSDFVAMGSDNTYYDDQQEADVYYTEEQDLIFEKYIVHVDFGENEIPETKLNNSLFIEMRDIENQTLISVWWNVREDALYSVYKEKDALIDVSATISDSVLYRGKSTSLVVKTDFTQDVEGSKTIYDTDYFDDKMGIKISIYDNNGNRLNSDSLLGVSFILDKVTYYPRIDGTVRIKIADKVSNVLSRITIDTSQNTTLATGDYTIRVESFGSPDGIYYGIEPSDTVDVPITIIDSNYGLKIYTDDKSKTIDKETGQTEYGSNFVWVNMEYSSALSHPNVTVSLYRRTYDDTYSLNYELVDFKDYVSNQLIETSHFLEYFVEQAPVNGSRTQKDYTLKENLRTGTYKIVYKLYDSESYIGEAFDYMIVK